MAAAPPPPPPPNQGNNDITNAALQDFNYPMMETLDRVGDAGAVLLGLQGMLAGGSLGWEAGTVIGAFGGPPGAFLGGLAGAAVGAGIGSSPKWSPRLAIRGARGVASSIRNRLDARKRAAQASGITEAKAGVGKLPGTTKGNPQATERRDDERERRNRVETDASRAAREEESEVQRILDRYHSLGPTWQGNPKNRYDKNETFIGGQFFEAGDIVPWEIVLANIQLDKLKGQPWYDEAKTFHDWGIKKGSKRSSSQILRRQRERKAKEAEEAAESSAAYRSKVQQFSREGAESREALERAESERIAQRSGRADVVLEPTEAMKSRWRRRDCEASVEDFTTWSDLKAYIEKCPKHERGLDKTVAKGAAKKLAKDRVPDDIFGSMGDVQAWVAANP